MLSFWGKSIIYLFRNFHNVRLALVTVLALSVVTTFILYAESKEKPILDVHNSFQEKQIPELYAIEVSNPSPLDDCLFSQTPKKATADVRLPSLFPRLNFSTSRASRRWWIWNESLEKRFQAARAANIPMKVIVVPFSHNDPGWTQTFHVVAKADSSQILQNIVDKLSEHKLMTFVWTEVSFLAYWYHQPSTSSESKEKLLDLLRSGRLEIVGGGWVMPDEASTTTYAIVDQLIEGHQWLAHHLNVTPTTSWAIDPFGLGATLPYILHKAGITSTVIVRVHYAWKRFFAENQMTDFIWRQSWDAENTSDVLIHHHPHDSYSIANTIGANVKFRQFDFFPILNNGPGDSFETLVELARDFAFEMKRVASLNDRHAALLLLGDDSRYINSQEFDLKYEEFQRLFAYINQHPEMNLNVRFGTISDYFRIVRDTRSNGREFSPFPVVSGDFFPFAENAISQVPSYWTGYFSNRPFIKALGRKLERVLRSAEILFSSSNGASSQKWPFSVKGIYTKLIEARQSLALFQHHDAITGTSKSHVMRDFEEILRAAVGNAISVVTFSVRSLLVTEETTEQYDESNSFQWTDRGDSCENFFGPTQEQTMTYVAFNPLSHRRHYHFQCCVRYHSGKKYSVIDDGGHSLPLQITSSGNVHTLNVLLYLLPFSTTSYKVQIVPSASDLDQNCLSQQRVFRYSTNPDADTRYLRKFKKVLDSDFVVLKNGFLEAEFDLKTSLLKSLRLSRENIPRTTSVKLLSYIPGRYSGAYLMKPKSVIDTLDYFQGLSNYTDQRIVTVDEGKVFSQITGSMSTYFSHKMKLYHDPETLLAKGIYIEMFWNISSKMFTNVELVMQIRSSLLETSFFTDSSGFQMIRRHRVEQLDIEGNYFPITRMAYIENSESRLSLLMDQPFGVASIRDGWLEVMLDRKINHDDGRGLGEGIDDNRPHTSRFFLLYESRPNPRNAADSVSHPSWVAHRLSDTLNHPADIWQVNGNPPDRSYGVPLFSRLFPCDVHLINLRSLSSDRDFYVPSDRALAIFHRRGWDCSWSHGKAPGRCDHSALAGRQIHVAMRSFVRPVIGMTETTLTGMEKRNDTPTARTSLEPPDIPNMEIRAWKLTF